MILHDYFNLTHGVVIMAMLVKGVLSLCLHFVQGFCLLKYLSRGVHCETMLFFKLLWKSSMNTSRVTHLFISNSVLFLSVAAVFCPLILGDLPTGEENQTQQTN